MAATAYPLPAFFDGLKARGLELRADADDSLVLSGPKEARTEKLRLYVKSQKPAILEYLRGADWDLLALGREIDAEIEAQMAAEAALHAIGESREEDDDSGYGERIRAAYAAALAGEMPIVRVQLCPGTSTDDPNAWMVKAVARCRRQRPDARSGPDFEEYLDRTLNEQLGIDAVADWWAAQSQIRQI